MRFATFVRREQSFRSAIPHGVAYKCKRAPRRFHPIRAPKHPSRVRHALDHQRVPTGKNFLIASRTDAGLARIEQLRLRRGQQRFALFDWPGQRACHVRKWHRHHQIPEMHFKIGRLIEAVVQRDHTIFFRRQQLLDLMQRPDVKLAFVAF